MEKSKCSRKLIHFAWISYKQRMMLIIIVMGFSMVLSKAQSSRVDSLTASLAQVSTLQDSVDILIEICYSLQKDRKYDELKPILATTSRMAHQNNYARGIAFSEMYIGKVLYKDKNYPAASEKYDLAMQMFTELADPIGLARGSMSIAHVYYRTMKQEEAIEQYKKTIALYAQTGRSHRQECETESMLSYGRISGMYNILAKYDQAEYYSWKTIAFADSLHNPQEMGFGYMNLGVIHTNLHHHEKAVEYFSKMFSYWEEWKGPWNIDMKMGAANAYYSFGRMYGRYKIDISKAMEYYPKAISLFEEIKDERMWLYAINDYSKDLFSNGKYEASLKYALEALTLAEKLDQKAGIADAHFNIGQLFAYHKNYEEAEQHLSQAFQIMEQQKNIQGLGNISFRRGQMKMEQGKKEEAVSYYHRTLELAAEAKDTFQLVTTYTNLLLQNIPLPDYDKVIECFKAQIKTDESRQNWRQCMYDYRFLGICYGLNGHHAASHESLTRSLALAIQLNNAQGIKWAYQSLQELSESQLEYEKALEYSEMVAAWSDTVYVRTNSKIIEEIQAKYDTEKKEKEIQLLQSEKEINSLKFLVQEESLKRFQIEKDHLSTENIFHRTQLDLMSNERELQECVNEQNEITSQFQNIEIEQKEKEVQILNQKAQIQMLALRKQKMLRNFLFTGIGLFGLLGFLGYGYYTTRQRLKLQTLRNKIARDLHDDVGSTLSSIYIFSEIAREQSREVIPMLDTIGESSKKMLDAMADIVWTIHPENDNFEKIIDRMRSFAYELLGARKIDFEFDAPEDLHNIKLPMEVRKNLYLIFKEATNNMVKYANADKAYFSLTEENKKLTMLIRDNGKGFNTAAVSTGNGLKNMQKRALEIGGNLQIESINNGGTMIKLSLSI